MEFCWSLLIFVSFFHSLAAWGDSPKVRLTDVKTITLYHGKMTTGRRSKPVPQLHCVGGTAGCSAFVPQVVQCYNRGSDGIDVQWECKTDMDNAFRFGTIDVICEGYDYPDDPYILKGSCGLEYTIDLTKEGLKQKGGGGHNYYGGDNNYGYQSSYNAKQSVPGKESSLFGNVILIIIIILLIIAISKICGRNRQYSPTDDDFTDPSSRYGGYGQAPPPPGFRSGMGGGYGNDGSCGQSSMGSSSPLGGAGSFMTGAAAGGVLGYMFGNRNNRSDYNYGSRSSGGGSSFDSSFSSGTRSASGFGGTRRR